MFPYSYYPYSNYHQNLPHFMYSTPATIPHFDSKPSGWKPVPYEPGTYCGKLGGETVHLSVHQGGYVIKSHHPHITIPDHWHL